ncbi:hypothetical protein [Adhaeribacter pallidiroseus]|uniref:Uncharacterized protein n=1 Tax=Adhaeribacter pallidiroseus TaxID=2072847 RepID=A0A369QJ60_9BACT|nr:hypothetical protein [Adhaeribacter pallidiroseus]RDC63287.1 hypothetical protein AHMF7616_01889 [Adhaeribacter pallidiroseus]
MTSSLTFAYALNSFEIVPADYTGNWQVIVTEPELGIRKRYILLGIAAANRGAVEVEYVVQHLAANDSIIKQEQKKFNAITQENQAYFYYLTLKLGEPIGERLDKMQVNGLLIDVYGFSYGIYGSDGNFYPPLSFTHQVEPNPQFLVSEGTPAILPTFDEETHYELTPYVPAVEPVYSYTATVTVSAHDGAAAEMVLYKLGDYQVQTSNVFENVPKGTYLLFVTTASSMPCTRIVVV